MNTTSGPPAVAGTRCPLSVIVVSASNSVDTCRYTLPGSSHSLTGTPSNDTFCAPGEIG